MMKFEDRRDAGHQLAIKLVEDAKIVQSETQDLLVLSIPRGGTVIGDVVAKHLACAHDVLIVKKIGFPGQEELAIGAVAEDGIVLLNHNMIAAYDLTNYEVSNAIAKAQFRVERYTDMFRQGKPLDVADKTVILVDDGIATGETIKAGLHWLKEKQHGVQDIIVIVPVCSQDSLHQLQALVDQVISLHTPMNFRAVSLYYRDFKPIDDKNVLDILRDRSL